MSNVQLVTSKTDKLVYNTQKTTEQLQTMLVKYMEEKDQLKDQKFAIATGQDGMDDLDMDMVEEKM